MYSEVETALHLDGATCNRAGQHKVHDRQCSHWTIDITQHSRNINLTVAVTPGVIK